MATYRYSGSPQFVTVAQTGTYDIIAFGAEGGGIRGASGGYGAEVGGTFELTAGEKLELIVGGAGGYSSSFAGGGGGGTFVLANYGGTYKPILVAGGGGGARGSYVGRPGTLMPGAGQGGAAGGGFAAGGGGAGVKSSGGSPPDKTDTGGSNHVGGYAGGATRPAGGAGGFGGGGGGYNGGGGGGGYSGGQGGDGGLLTVAGTGAGGGSYDGGVPNATQTMAGENPGNGRIVFLPNAVTCFVTGTRIRTTRGECAMEDLVVGDVAVTASGATRPIVWIGHRDTNCRGHHELHPVRVGAHAFSEDMPERDLMLSPGHPVLVGADADGSGGHLVPIMCLINGTTVRRVAVERVTYWHVELDEHDVLLAEGLPAESYIDLGSRPWFAGADGALYDPDLALPGMPGRCRPVAIDGPVVEAARRQLDAAFAMRLNDACAWPEAASATAFQC